MTETSGDIPEFLKPRVKQRAVEEIQRWKDARSDLLEKRKETLRGYIITSGLDKEGLKRGNMGMEYQFETVGRGKWQVLVGEKMEYSSPPDLESWRRAEIARDLTINQSLGQTVSGQENPQMRAVNFLEANWSRLAGIFSPAQKEGVESMSFSNVRLGGVVLDFVGVGPDGRYMVFEISRPGGESQIEQHRQALIDLGIPEGMITVFSVNFSPVARQTTLLITQR